MQARVKAKQDRFRELICCQEEEQTAMRRNLYKEVRCAAKKAVAEAKYNAYEAMYNHLDTKEGQNDVYKLAKARERRIRELGYVRFIKDDDEQVLVSDNDIRCRWYKFFRKLFNEAHINERS